MNQPEVRPATPISWGDASASADQPAWQGPPARRSGSATPEPRHAAYVESPAPAYDPALDEPAPAPDAPSADYAQPWVQGGTAHTAEEVHQVWAEHHTSPEALSGEPEPAMAAPAPAAPPEPAADDDSLTLGRARSNSIVLDDMLVSRHHARISADDQGLIIEDLGSRNGTFVNGRRVQTTRLHEGDRIGIGASTFEVRDGWLVSA